MKTSSIITLCLYGFLYATNAEATCTLGAPHDYPISNVDFSHVHLTDRFWMPRIRQNQEVTIPIALKQCWDTGRIDNFKKAAHLMDGYFGTENPFDDSDVFKILEGLAYSLQNLPNKELEREMDEIISYIAEAQEPDGYLYTARTAAEPGKLHPWVHQERWRNAPDLSHELYNMGHLYEAAAAHYIATGKRTLLDVALKNADLLVDDFLGKQLPYEPGHQIIEAGLVKLYRITGKQQYLELAKYFLDLRGDRGQARAEYSQTHLPVVQQREAVGHAVRAAYMYSGIADVAALTGNEAYLNTINAIWDNVVSKKLYITGGIGAMRGGEAFGANYVLPNTTAYCETCAAIANVYWNWRMFLLFGDSKYYDVLERTLYNGVLSGISLSGDRFFYPNPLESKGGYSRSEWFGCACCPSNLCRFIASVGGYMYAHKDNMVYVNLYAQGTADIPLGKGTITLSQVTDYPWDGNIKIRVDDIKKTKDEVTLMMRLPGWATGKPVPSDLYHYAGNSQGDIHVKLKINGVDTQYEVKDGYMKVSRRWKKGDVISFDLPMDVRLVEAHPDVVDDDGCLSIERGPIVYCVERTDNPDTYNQLMLPAGTIGTVMDFSIGTHSGMKQLRMQAPTPFTAIPYFAWANRGDRGMKVWIPENERSLSGALGPVEKADTIHLSISMPPRNDYSPQESIPLSKESVCKLLQVTPEQFDSQMGSRIAYSAINPDGSADIESTATPPGHWFNAQNHTCGWAVSGCKLFSEFHTDGQMRLQIGQLPNACKSGEHFVIRQALTLRATRDTEARRVVFEVGIRIE